MTVTSCNVFDDRRPSQLTGQAGRRGGRRAFDRASSVGSPRRDVTLLRDAQVADVSIDWERARNQSDLGAERSLVGATRSQIAHT